MAPGEHGGQQNADSHSEKSAGHCPVAARSASGGAGEIHRRGGGLNSPPLTVFADDNKTLLGSEADIARLVAESLGLEVNVVPTSWEDWPLGVTSGKYDAAISNITVTKERKEKFDFATYRKDSLGFYVKSTSPLSKIDKAEDIAGLKIIVGSGTNQRRSCWRGTRRTSRRG